MTIEPLAQLSIIADLTAMALAVLLYFKNHARKSAQTELSTAVSVREELINARAQLASTESNLQQAKCDLLSKDGAIESKSAELREVHGKLQAALAQVEAEKTNAQNLMEVKDQQIQDQMLLIEDAKTQMKDVFAGTANETIRLVLEDLESRTSSDHRLREQKFNELIKPIGDGLERLGKRCEDSDKVLASLQSGLSEQVNSMLDASHGLSNALRRPNVRGSWGEMTLKNALDDAGLTMAWTTYFRTARLQKVADFGQMS